MCRPLALCETGLLKVAMSPAARLHPVHPGPSRLLTAQGTGQRAGFLDPGRSLLSLLTELGQALQGPRVGSGRTGQSPHWRGSRRRFHRINPAVDVPASLSRHHQRIFW
mmetsp:Transcript_53487/g.148273  ORF Transcript_53487/g.148273 Transcript_53487/m.148273 type:complete len:109 (-) Transcript_53487:993-1319(-)